MPRFRLRPPAYLMTGIGRMGITGNVQAQTTKSLGSVLLGGRGRVTTGGGFSYVVPPPVGDEWIISPLTFQEGSGQTADLKPTVPSAYADGGAFDASLGLVYTSFNLTENPISEGGRWVNGKTNGVDWQDIATADGNANATHKMVIATPQIYDDNIAHISTSYRTFNPNQWVEGTLYRNGSYNADHEIELYTRLLITPNNARGYEAYWNVAVGSITIYIVRWNGPLNDFTYLNSASIAGTGATGQVMRMECTGTNPVIITVKVNGVTVVTASDGTAQRILTGQPGLGQNPYGASANFTDWAFSDWVAGDDVGAELPSGMTLSDDGVLSVGTAQEAPATNVVVGYTEPAALPTLTLHPTVTGTLPYMATWFPLEGIVPVGYNVISPDDANLRGSVLSAWPDGSAKVVVVAGETAVSNGVQKPIRLRAGKGSGTKLTAARIQTIIPNGISVNFGGGAQSLSQAQLGSPEYTWWANPSHICCRYRLSANNGNLGVVIDIHAFKAGVSNRAFVEIVVENSLINASATSIPNPANVTYTGATVSVNGVSLNIGNGANSSSGPGGSHTASRAWYVSTWVGGDPGVEVTHDIASIQAHPMFYRVWKTPDATWNFQTVYGNDLYVPWFQPPAPGSSADMVARAAAGERLNVPNMGAYGDALAIGPIMQWDAQYLQTGDKYVRRACIATALSALKLDINWRDQTTGLVPSYAQIGYKSSTWATGWPSGTGGEPLWEHAHAPAIGLMAFMCRPSPVFIELAQKMAIKHYSYGKNLGAAKPVFDGSYQCRGQMWAMRMWNHAAFLTPTTVHANETAIKTGLQAWIHYGLLHFELYKNEPKNTLGFIWPFLPTWLSDQEPTGYPGYQFSLFEFHFGVPEIHKGAASKLLDGTQHTKYVEIADWMCAQPVRFVNEAVAGEWRSIATYRWWLGDGPENTDLSTYLVRGNGTYNEWWAWWFTDSPPATSGQWIGMSRPAFAARLWSGATLPAPEQHSSYDVQFFSAFSAAVERGISGADTAWSKVVANITDFDTGASPWSRHCRFTPRFQAYPRNK